MIGEINKATRDFARSPEVKYVVATALSFNHFQEVFRMEIPGYRLYVRRRLPRYLAESHREARERSRRSIGGDYPEDVLSQRYAAAWIYVRGRSPHDLRR